MRAAVLILSLSLALAAPAGAQPAKGLRGAQPPDTPATSERTTAPAEPSALPDPAATAMMSPLPPLPVDGAAQCRLDCAQDYYFCLSSDMADDCPGAWGQCRAACVAAPVLPQS